MNYRMMLRIVSYILRAEAALLLPSLAVAVIGGEKTVPAILITIALLAAASLVTCLVKPSSKTIYTREGFVIVSASWMLVSLFGALPYYFSGCIPGFINCLFESVSGLTTTGATALRDVEILPKSLLLWRSLSLWIGGMGVLVFVMAVMPLAGGRAMHLMRAEVPGPSFGKIVPKIKNTAMILYGLYIALTAVMVFFLLGGGMPVFDSFCYAFATAGTGGFSITNSGLAIYNSPYIEWVVAVFMVIFSINFNLYYLVLLREFRRVIKDEELTVFLCVVGAAAVMITANIWRINGNFALSVREAFFQTASVASTSGFAIVDYGAWPELSRILIVMMMLGGACSGSTGGGFKISRFIIVVRSIKNEIKRMLHPRSVNSVKLGGKPVEQETVTSVYVFMLTALFISAISFLLISLDDFDFTTTVTSVLACISNMGPGLGDVGPAGNYAGFSALSKLVLMLDMFFGRLEVFPMIMLFSPSVWRRSLR